MRSPTRFWGYNLWPFVLATVLCLAPWGWAQAKDLPDFADLVEKAGPAVVNIRTTERVPEGARSPFRRRLPSSGKEDGDSPHGEGSGFLVSDDGFVMTNAHVVAGAKEVIVTLTDKREFKAKIIGADERTDVAVVKIEATGLPFLRSGDVGKLRVGEWVIAIGSPFGLENSVTAGIVSAKQRETGSDISFLQTDVAVNPGNSGGPLLNVRGEVVGINSQILSPVGSFVGISLAIPMDEATRVAEQLKANGRVVRGYLGIQPTEVPRDLPEEYGLGKFKHRGAFVRQVVRGSPAEKAGIQPGDVVLLLNGKPVEGPVELRRALGLIKPGAPVTLQINRRGKSMELKLNLAELTGAVESTGTADKEDASGPKVSAAAKAWGLGVANLTDSERQNNRSAHGVRIQSVAAGAKSVGLRVGDVILAIGTTDVHDLKKFDAAIAAFDKASALPLTVLRGEWAQFVRVPVLK
jgi:serine protease Do